MSDRHDDFCAEVDPELVGGEANVAVVDPGIARENRFARSDRDFGVLSPHCREIEFGGEHGVNGDYEEKQSADHGGRSKGPALWAGKPYGLGELQERGTSVDTGMDRKTQFSL